MRFGPGSELVQVALGDLVASAAEALEQPAPPGGHVDVNAATLSVSVTPG